MKVFAFALCILALAAQPLAAHPHVWIDASVKLSLDAGRLVALEVTWLFDELYGELLLEDFDENGDGTLSEEELAYLVQVSAENLPESNFFTHIRIDGQEFYVTAVEDFTAFYQEGRVAYRFTVPINARPEAKLTPVAIGLFDASYYVEVLLAEENPISFEGGSCAWRLEEDQNQPLYFGYYFPTYIWLEC